VKKEELAEEVLHDAFLKIWDKIGEYSSQKGKLFTWMLNITRNLSIDKIRSKEFRKSAKTDDISLNVSINDGEYSNKHKPEHIGIKELLDNLPEDQKSLIDLMYFQGYSQSEIAEEYDIPLGTVKTRVRTAMQKLREMFK
jgi:RNA polymerase sigma factor (sigma-70 family)